MPRPALVAAYALWLLWGASWLVASLWKGREVARAPNRAALPWLLVAAAGFAALFGEAPDRLRPLWGAMPPLDWAMVALVAIGFAFAWWARITLGKLWSGVIVAREGHRIVDTGPYAIVRHPIYTGLFVAGLALALLKATPLALLGFLVLVVGFAGKARVEERFLGGELGEARYAAYRARVPMLVPFVR